MKAFIFAAGKGTRLQPITNSKPKALVEIAGKTLLEITIKRLMSAGIKDILINVHHFANQICEYLQLHNNFGANISILDETNLLLDTGGAIKNAAHLFLDTDCVLVHNVDVITDLNYTELINNHLKTGALITLAVRDRRTERYFLFDRNNDLCGWQNVKTAKEIIVRLSEDDFVPLAFSGIHIINTNVPNLFTRSGVFSIVDAYLQLAAEHIIKAYPHNDTFWMDIGKINELEEICKNTPAFIQNLK